MTKQPIKFKIEKEVLKYFNEQGACFQMEDPYPRYLFYNSYFKVNSEEDLNNGITEIINFNANLNDELHKEVISLVRDCLPTPEVKVEDIERIDGILFDLDNELYELCHELISTPFFMFKKRWKINSNIKQIKSIISLVKGYK